MEAAINRRRLIVMTILLVACFVGLGCRLFHLQWTRHAEFVELAARQHDHSYYREPRRGDILDRRGNLLATSVPVKTVCADPALLKGHEVEMARFLAPFLKTNESYLLSHFSKQTFTNAQGEVRADHYTRLKQKVPMDEWEDIHAALAQQYTNVLTATAQAGRPLKGRALLELQSVWLRSIYTEPDQIRSYPNGALAAHILGFTGNRTAVIDGRTNSFTAGVEGIEATLDEQLRGIRGWVKTERDNRRRELFVFREQDVQSRPGLDVILTIDARIQQIVEEELAPVMAKHFPQSASAVVIRPRTGEILAMATLPTFDPNAPGRSDAAARRNRVITDTFEPGSTFKTVVMARALHDGTVRLSDQFDCENGVFRFANRLLHDSEHHGIMSVEEIISKSSNIGTAKVAIRCGKERVYDGILQFGFGERTGIPLTGEVRGYLPKLKDWKLIHISRIPIGQGVSATQLQMAMAMCAVANGGVLMRPMLVESLVDAKGQPVAKYEPQAVRRVVSEAAARATIHALKSVVNEGTAEKAALDYYTVAGKTGTAQKVVDGQYSHDKFYASFIGFFPASNPELCIAVSVDEPVKKTGYYGGQVAAPVFKRIAERSATFLNIKPDLQPGATGDVMAEGKSPRSGVARVERN